MAILTVVAVWCPEFTAAILSFPPPDEGALTLLTHRQTQPNPSPPTHPRVRTQTTVGVCVSQQVVLALEVAEEVLVAHELECCLLHRRGVLAQGEIVQRAQVEEGLLPKEPHRI